MSVAQATGLPYLKRDVYKTRESCSKTSGGSVAGDDVRRINSRNAARAFSGTAVGLLWLALTLLFDVGLGHYAFGRQWELPGEDFNLLHGGMFPVELVLLTAMPLIAARLAKTERRRL